jgi:hypothetical protein
MVRQDAARHAVHRDADQRGRSVSQPGTRSRRQPPLRVALVVTLTSLAGILFYSVPSNAAYTQLVSPLSTVIAYDSFNRSVAAGLGNAEDRRGMVDLR